MTLATQVDIPIESPPFGGGLFRFSADLYLEMVRLGLLDKDHRVELLDGLIVTKMGKNPPHILATKRIVSTLSGVLPAGWHVSKEDPVRLSESVPEPDCAVLRGTADDYSDRLPTAAEVALVVEVADASLLRDRNVKGVAYGRDGIPVYVLANLVDDRFEVYSDPTGPSATPGYRSCVHYDRGDTLPVVIAGREVARLAVSDLLP